MKQKDKKSQISLGKDQNIVKFSAWFKKSLTGVYFESCSGKSIKCIGRSYKNDDSRFVVNDNRSNLKALCCGTGNNIDFIEFYYFVDK